MGQQRVYTHFDFQYNNSTGVDGNNLQLTKDIDFERASGRVAGLIESDICNVVSSPQKSLSWPVVALFFDLGDTHVVRESGLVPRHYRCSVLGNYPQVSGAVIDLRGDLEKMRSM